MLLLHSLITVSKLIVLHVHSQASAAVFSGTPQIIWTSLFLKFYSLLFLWTLSPNWSVPHLILAVSRSLCVIGPTT